jgi:hypothetical protein
MDKAAGISCRWPGEHGFTASHESPLLDVYVDVSQKASGSLLKPLHSVAVQRLVNDHAANLYDEVIALIAKDSARRPIEPSPSASPTAPVTQPTATDVAPAPEGEPQAASQPEFLTGDEAGHDTQDEATRFVKLPRRRTAGGPVLVEPAASAGDQDEAVNQAIAKGQALIAEAAAEEAAAKSDGSRLRKR